jgi:hypothetical protein
VSGSGTGLTESAGPDPTGQRAPGLPEHYWPAVLGESSALGESGAPGWTERLLGETKRQRCQTKRLTSCAYVAFPGGPKPHRPGRPGPAFFPRLGEPMHSVSH